MYFVLQDSLPELEPSNNLTSVLVLVGIILLLIILVAVGGKSGKTSGRTSKGGKYKFSKGKFRKVARKLGLDKSQVHVLESLVKMFKLKTPMKLFSSPAYFDKVLAQAIAYLDDMSLPENTRESRKLVLYKIKQTIENNTAISSKLTNTKQLRTGQPVYVAVQRQNQKYKTKISANMRNYFTLTIPQTPFGQEVRFPRETKVVMYCEWHYGESYRFQSKILGYNNVRGNASMLVSHTGRIQRAHQRRYRRRNIDKAAYMYPVKILEMGIGKDKSRKAVIQQNLKTLGSLVDISAGGCAIKSNHPFGKNELVRVDFEAERGRPITVFGKIIRLNKNGRQGGTMHLTFTSISKKNINKINAYVYGLS